MQRMHCKTPSLRRQMKMGSAEVMQAYRKIRKERQPIGKFDVFENGEIFVEKVKRHLKYC